MKTVRRWTVPACAAVLRFVGKPRGKTQIILLLAYDGQRTMALVPVAGSLCKRSFVCSFYARSRWSLFIPDSVLSTIVSMQPCWPDYDSAICVPRTL